MHPIDEAIQEMQARHRRRTYPPITLPELDALTTPQLRQLAKDKHIAAANRQTLILALYDLEHTYKPLLNQKRAKRKKGKV